MPPLPSLASRVLLWCSIALVLLSYLGGPSYFVEAKAGRGMGSKADPKSPPIKQDIPYIVCDVCLRSVAQTWELMGQLQRESAAAGKKIHEDEIAEKIEEVCNPEGEAGRWMTSLDIEERPFEKKKYSYSKKEETSNMELVIREYKGERQRCQRECQTIAEACHRAVGGASLDLSEDYYKFLSDLRQSGKAAHTPLDPVLLQGLQRKYCFQNDDVCKDRQPQNRLPVKYARPNEEFTPLSDAELKLEDMQASMKKFGLGGTMFSRDDIGNIDPSDLSEDDL